MQPSTRMIPAVVVALLAGALRGLQINGGLLVTDVGISVSQVGLLFTVLGIASVVVSPIAMVLAGYVWGMDGSVPETWAAFAGLAVGATLVGFVAAYLVVVALAVVAGGGHVLAELFPKLLGDAFVAVGLLHVALAGLAGAAVAHFRADETRNSNRPAA